MLQDRAGFRHYEYWHQAEPVSQVRTQVRRAVVGQDAVEFDFERYQSGGVGSDLPGGRGQTSHLEFKLPG